MLNIIKQKQIFITLIVIFGVFTGSFLKAAIVSAENASYTLSKVSPGDEIDESSSFYDLKLAPGQTKTIQAKIRNTGATDITVADNVYSAFTNSNGEIDYTKNADKYDSSLKIKMSDIAKITASDLKAVVKAGEERTVSLEITMPETVGTGVILGSWHFKEEVADSESKSKGVSVQSQYAYALAIKITVGSEIAGPNLSLQNITTGLINYKKAFLAEIQNDQAALTTNTKIDGWVTKKGGTDVLYKYTMDDVDFAPNTNFKFPVYLGEDQMRAGDYTYHIRAITKDKKVGFSDKSWEWTKDFTVLAEEAQKVNKEAINDGKAQLSLLDYMRLYWYIILAVLVVIIALIIFIVLKVRAKRQHSEVRNEKVAEMMAEIKKNRETQE